MKNIITAENVSKAYRIGIKQKKSDTLLGAVWQGIKAPLNNFRALRNLRNLNGHDESIFWALKNVNFAVQEGEVLGIIGHNGAGKSTLLKILSRITDPTEGRITIHGRVSSLLEVGTGFHPDLTGRENIYMNGTILGMRKKEIDLRLEEIIAFSGISRYIDTPVKRYSSGMSVRLAFSVAAHLEPEILIIDEVLAVGDADFQKKCVGKMDQVAKGGRTILFVSHNLKLVESLCSKAMVLSDGKLVCEGAVRESLEYYKAQLGSEDQALIVRKDSNMTFKGLVNKKNLQEILYGQDLQIKALFNSDEALHGFHIDIAIQNEDGLNIVHSRSNWINETSFNLNERGDFLVDYQVRNSNLVPGKYFLEIYFYSGDNVLLHLKNIPAFNITPKNTLRGNFSLDNVQAFTIPQFSINFERQ